MQIARYFFCMRTSHSNPNAAELTHAPLASECRRRACIWCTIKFIELMVQVIWHKNCFVHLEEYNTSAGWTIHQSTLIKAWVTDFFWCSYEIGWLKIATLAQHYRQHFVRAEGLRVLSTVKVQGNLEWVNKIDLLRVLTRSFVVMQNLILGLALCVIGEQFLFGFGHIRHV